MNKEIPGHAQVVIVGGGIVGCSVAYHLTRLGRRDVVLLARVAVTSRRTMTRLVRLGVPPEWDVAGRLCLNDARLRNNDVATERGRKRR